jgi:tRNA threonylcarbamoyladenosine biosynthesis protein TsaB
VKEEANRMNNTVLAVETSTDLLGVSVVNKRGVLSEVTTSRPRVHSAMLLPLSVEALRMADLAMDDIDCFAVSQGPGSFTGLRIGCASVQGMALALGKGVVKVPTFEVYLRQCKAYDNLAIVQGKAKGQTVCAYFERIASFVSDEREFSCDYGFEEKVRIGPRTYTDFCEDLCKEPIEGPLWVTGDAAHEFSISASDLLPYEVRLVDEYLLLPKPGIVGLIGRRMFEQGLAVAPSLVTPEYYRQSQAEVLFSERGDEGERR